MGRLTLNPQLNEYHQETEFVRGEIKDNALKAVVKSPLFQMRVVRAKKGKGSFRRKMKHKGKDPCSEFSNVDFEQGFFVLFILVFISGWSYPELRLFSYVSQL